MNEIKKVLTTVFSRKNWYLREANENPHAMTICMLFLSFVSLCLTVINLIKAYWFMTGTTVVLVAGFLFAALLSWKKHMRESSVLAVFMVALIFSVYAITGENDGFAILWIALVPVVSLNLVSIEMGTIVSFYFQLFLFVLFYSPLKVICDGMYSATFMQRFPFLFLCAFGGSFVLAVNKEYNSVIRTIESYTDGLTGLYNRGRFIKELNEDYSAKGDFHVISFDLNGLKNANDNYGHEAGDKLIILTAGVLLETWGKMGSVFRLGGDEFAAIVCCSMDELNKSFDDFRSNLAKVNETSELDVNISVGCASRSVENITGIEALYKKSDEYMYVNKSAYYSDHEHERRRTAR